MTSAQGEPSEGDRRLYPTESERRESEQIKRELGIRDYTVVRSLPQRIAEDSDEGDTNK